MTTMQSFSFKLPKEEEEKLLSLHEYIWDTLSFRYQNCISCRTRTEFTCIKCGYCYSCHWKKEQIEEIELRDHLKDFYTSLSKSCSPIHDNNDQKTKSQQPRKEREQGQGKWVTINALG